MRWFRFAVLILVAMILQDGILSNLNVKINLLLILLVFFDIYGNTHHAVLCSFIIGLAADIINSSLGSYMISFGVIGTIFAYLNNIISIRKKTYQAVAIFIMTIIIGILSRFLYSVKGLTIPANFNSILLWTAVFSSIAGPFLFLAAAWWMGINTRSSRRY